MGPRWKRVLLTLQSSPRRVWRVSLTTTCPSPSPKKVTRWPAESPSPDRLSRSIRVPRKRVEKPPLRPVRIIDLSPRLSDAFVDRYLSEARYDELSTALSPRKTMGGASRPHLLFWRAQLLESEWGSASTGEALSLYERIVSHHPLSRYFTSARERRDYLRRRYIEIR